jgi:hypothetical protein
VGVVLKSGELLGVISARPLGAVGATGATTGEEGLVGIVTFRESSIFLVVQEATKKNIKNNNFNRVAIEAS